MADNKRWFKVWNSILTDPSFLDLPLDKLGQWTLLGSLISLHGKKGQITSPKKSLCSLLRCQNGDLESTILCLPNVSLRGLENDNDKITVIMNNWLKYQIDSTGYKRLKKWRKSQNDNGVRGEEKRREKEENKNKKKKKHIYGEFKHVKLTEKEYQELINKVTQEETDKWIKELDEGIEQKGYKYQSHYLTILKWKAKEESKGGPYR